MTQGIEITSFRLAPSLNADDFIRANTDVDAWLKQQSGFISRIMIEQADGRIIDLVIWKSAALAADAMPRLMRDLANSPVHAAIDQGTVSWEIAEIRHQIE